MRNYLLSGEFLYNKKVAAFFWFGLSLLVVFRVINGAEINTYLIYKSGYLHITEHQNLYLQYPEYNNVYLYGPVFTLIIAPFSLLPDRAGAILWIIANAAFLWFAVHQLNLPQRWKAFILLLCAHELMIMSLGYQINAFVAACILLGFAYMEKEKEGKALFFILLATFVKLYGIVGFAFFLFSKKPVRFILWSVMWSVVFFLAPLLFTNIQFIIQCYKDWLTGLLEKGDQNDSLTDPTVRFQNISVSGMIARIFNIPHFNDLFVLAPAAAAFASQYRPFRYFGDVRFRLYILCSVLIATVIFSNSSEALTYIIATPGMCIWYLLQPKTKRLYIFFAVLFFLTTMAYSDVFGSWVRIHVFRPYSLKALPPFILWLIILYQIHTKQFLKAVIPQMSGRPEAGEIEAGM